MRVIHVDVVPGERKYLRNAMAHEASANDGDMLLRAHIYPAV